jgi:hypothetical protein
MIDDMRLSSGARSRDLKGHDNHQSIPINCFIRKKSEGKSKNSPQSECTRVQKRQEITGNATKTEEREAARIARLIEWRFTCTQSGQSTPKIRK